MSNFNYTQVLASNPLVKQVFLDCLNHISVIYDLAAINKN